MKALPGNDSRIVWAGGGAMSTDCPVSMITGQSIALLEEYAAWKVLGGGSAPRDLPAKVVDALQVLEVELRGENSNEN
jgi:hypothetical protein